MAYAAAQVRGSLCTARQSLLGGRRSRFQLNFYRKGGRTGLEINRRAPQFLRDSAPGFLTASRGIQIFDSLKTVRDLNK